MLKKLKSKFVSWLLRGVHIDVLHIGEHSVVVSGTGINMDAQKIENVAEPDSDDDVPRRDTIDSKIATHAGVESAHHAKTTLFSTLIDRWDLAQAHRGADGKIMVFKGPAADPVEEDMVKYTEASVSGNSGGDGAWHDALDVDTRGMKSFSAVVKNTDGANSLNWRLRARPSNYSAGADEEIPECPGSETLGVGEKGLAELLKAYSRIKIQVQDTVAASAATYTIDYLINR